MAASEMTAREKHDRDRRKHAVWLEEIATWRTDHELALETLDQATAFIREHDALLDHHAELIAEHDRGLEAHESGQPAPLPDREDAPTSSDLERLEQLHQRVLDQHNRFRGRHPALIREIARLAAELKKVSHQPG